VLEQALEPIRNAQGVIRTRTQVMVSEFFVRAATIPDRHTCYRDW
jgi:hypothetical protein